MPKTTSPEDKLAVIGDWLDGETREDIVMNNKIGSGTL